MQTTKWLKGILIVAACTLSLAACGGGDGSEPVADACVWGDSEWDGCNWAE